MKRISVLLAFTLACATTFAQFPYRLLNPSAQEDFRLGVQAYQRGRIAESILLFERVLNLSPRDPLSLFWLGRAYYKNGLESTALERWAAAVRDGGRSLLAESFEEYVSSRRSIEPEAGNEGYVNSGEFAGRQGKETRFLRPSWIYPEKNGNILVVSHGTGEILRIDVNGVVRARFRGGLGGFDHPFALASARDGGFWVSEFQGDRVSLCDADGNPVLRISGENARDRLSGPHYIATDSSGFLYVVDYGNGRVVKYSPAGEFLLDFGRASYGFPGFRSPTGIAVRGGRVYVADGVRKSIYVFDSSGNYLDTLAEGSLLSPEGLSFSGDEELLISDKARILSLDIQTEELREIYRPSQRGARIVCAVKDTNGNLLASDFDASRVEILSDPAIVYGGYFVEIERIRSDSFPIVEADVYVRNRFGNPIVGLDQGNFYASEHIVTEKTVKEGETEARVKTENLESVKDLTLVGRGEDTPGYSVAILVERSPQIEAYRSEVRQSVETTAANLGAGSETMLISAGRIPAVISSLSEGASGPSLARQVLSSPSDPRWRFDTALRLAVSSLSSSSRRSAIVYVTTGAVNESGFESTSLAELGAYLRNNGIRFYAVLVGDSPASAAIEYLTGTAGGRIFHIWDAPGLKEIARDMGEATSGRYRLRFTSAADPGFGRTYLSAVVEAYLFKKSGRDELGYFAPQR